MKILVFDDNVFNCVSARLTLTGYDHTIVSTYDEAQAELCPKIDSKRVEYLQNEFAKDVGLPDGFKRYSRGVTEEQKNIWREVERRTKTQIAIENARDFDVVMTDLMVLPSDQALANKYKFAGKEMPIGTIIALLAIYRGVKNVAVVTDTNHHNHPASAAFDCFGKYTSLAQGVNVLCTNKVDHIMINKDTLELVDEEFLNSEQGRAKYPKLDYEIHEYPWRQGIVVGKNWGVVLDNLLSQKQE